MSILAGTRENCLSTGGRVEALMLMTLIANTIAPTILWSEQLLMERGHRRHARAGASGRGRRHRGFAAEITAQMKIRDRAGASQAVPLASASR
jgi:hypothetical protein